MYHIFFNTSSGYVKYLAVLLHSIVRHTKKDAQAQHATAESNPHTLPHTTSAYVFHILLDFASFDDGSQNELNALQKLVTKLNAIYPCQLMLHNCSALLEQIEPQPSVNRVIYGRIFVSHFLDDSIQKCVYLDVDTLVLGDVRELFAISLGGNLLALSQDVVTKQIPLQAKNPNLAPYHFNPNYTYCNSGVMLIDMIKWRELQIERQLLEFLHKYQVVCFDQDAINAVCSVYGILNLDCVWNFQYEFYNRHRFYENNPHIPSSASAPLLYNATKLRQTFLERKIIHYVCNPKPWESPYLALDSTHLPIFAYDREVWWHIARETPYFAPTLIERQKHFADTALRDYAYVLSKDLQNMQKRIDTMSLLLKNPFAFLYRRILAYIKRQ